MVSGNLRRHLGAPLPSGDELEFQPPIQMLLFRCLSPRVSQGSRLCLFVMHSAAIHKQIDINLCQPFLFKNMNYSRNITILIRIIKIRVLGEGAMRWCISKITFSPNIKCAKAA